MDSSFDNPRCVFFFFSSRVCSTLSVPQLFTPAFLHGVVCEQKIIPRFLFTIFIPQLNLLVFALIDYLQMEKCTRNQCKLGTYNECIT